MSNAINSLLFCLKIETTNNSIITQTQELKTEEKLNDESKKVLTYLKYFRNISKFNVFDEIKTKKKTKELIQIPLILNNNKIQYSEQYNGYMVPWNHTQTSEDGKLNSHFLNFIENIYLELEENLFQINKIKKTKKYNIYKVFFNKEEKYIHYEDKNSKEEKNIAYFIQNKELLEKLDNSIDKIIFFIRKYKKDEKLIPIKEKQENFYFYKEIQYIYEVISSAFKIMKEIEAQIKEREFYENETQKEALLKIISEEVKIYKTLLFKEFMVSVGAILLNEEKIGKESFPIIFTSIISLEYLFKQKDAFLLIKPQNTPNISKDNVVVNDPKMLDIPEDEQQLMIPFEMVNKLYDEESLNSDIFENGLIVNPNKWNYYIDILQDILKNKIKNYKIINSLILFPLSDKKNDALLKSYQCAIDTILAKNGRGLETSLLSKLILQKERKTLELTNIENENSSLGMLKEGLIHHEKGFDHFGLNENQRIFCKESIEMMEKDSETNVIALNGPPGTGKTTVLQTMVASLVVKAMLNNEKSPPIIFGCSATKQAKNNIIAGFQHQEVHEKNDTKIFKRWINLENNENINYGISTQKIENVKTPEDIILEIKNDYENHKKIYIEEYNLFINDFLKNGAFSIFKETQKKQFKNEYVFGKKTLEKIEEIQIFSASSPKEISDNLRYIGIQLHEILEETFNRKNKLIMKLKNMQEANENNLKKIKNYIFELDGNHDLKELKYYVDIKNENIFKENEQKVNICNEIIKYHPESIIQNFLNNFEYPVGIKRIKLALIKNYDSALKEIDDVITIMIDNVFKPTLFHISARYFEGVFLTDEFLKIENFEGKPKAEKKLSDYYKKIACICPVFVSTLHAFNNQVRYYNGGDSCNFGFSDLLIIDEAGQASVDTAAIGLLLTKKTVVLGDSYQIEPVFSINENQDQGFYNTSFKQPLDIKKFLWNCSGTSILKVCQEHTPWHPYKKQKLERGLYLLEHNRCPIEIISFCDDLIYNNNLKYSISSYYSENDALKTPQYLNDSNLLEKMSLSYIRNKKIFSSSLSFNGQQPMKLIANDGQRDSNMVNKVEIDSILNWIDSHYLEILKNNPSKKLNQIIAIITPFKKQAFEISKRGRNKNNFNSEIKKNQHNYFSFDHKDKITIGTVHSLQGAEIPIVLFSNCYGDNNNISKPFIDRQKSILNVAASRAKQSFYVFANEKFLIKFKDNPDSATGALYNAIKKYDRHNIEIWTPENETIFNEDDFPAHF